MDNINTENICSRLVRLLVFVLTLTILINFLFSNKLDEMTILYIVIVSSISFMFVNTYYPNVEITDDK